MIKIQENNKLIDAFKRTKSNLFPQRIVQLASRSYEKFVTRASKVKSSAGKVIKSKQTCSNQLKKPLPRNITFYFDDRAGGNASKLKRQQTYGKSVQNLYESRKNQYISLIKQRRTACKTAEFNSIARMQTQPVSVFKFSESFFYDQLNLIKRKKNKSPVEGRGFRIKSEHCSSNSVLVIEPRQLITKKQSKAISQFFNTEIKEAQPLEVQAESVKEKIPISSFIKSKKSTKKALLAKQLSNTMNQQDYSPFRSHFTKKGHFKFGLNQKSSQTKNKDRLILYHDFLWKVNYSNGLFVKASSKDTCYKVFIGPGNNSNLIMSLMRKRFWWIISDGSQNCNFSWSQLRINRVTSSQQGSSTQLTLKTSKQMDTQIQDIEQKPQNKIFNRKDYQNWIQYSQNNQKRIIVEKTFKKRSLFIAFKKIRKIEGPQELKLHNHFIQNGYIGNKKALFYLMRNYYSQKEMNVFDFLPLTFHVSKGLQDPQWRRFQEYYQDLQSKKEHFQQNNNIWIMKPGQCSNRGNGIKVYHDIEDIKLRLKSGERNSDGSLRTFIIQNYINNPMLYNGRKFDIRHFLLITCINGAFKAYWFEQGYARTSSSFFTLKRGSNNFVHLTNDAIQKYSKDYSKYEQGNKVSYDRLNKYIKKVNNIEESNPFFDKILPQMKEITLDAVKATYLSLDPLRRQHNFELFGMDFMIDNNLKPFLIQINTNPCLEICCPLLAGLIPELLEQTLRLCVDPLFPPPEEWAGKKMWLPQNMLKSNRFHLIFDESVDRQNMKDGLQLSNSIGKIEEQSETFDNNGELTEQMD